MTNIGRATIDRLLALGHGEQPRQILRSSTAQVGSVALTSGLGFVFWFVAALAFPPAAIGVASATISAMLLLASLATFGLGTMLIGELPRHRGREPGLIAAAMIAAGVAGWTFAFVFSIFAGALSAELQPLAEPLFMILFSIGVGLTAALAVLDPALLGLLRGDLQLARTAVFSVVKLGLLVLASFAIVNAQPSVIIVGTWVVGLLLSIVALALYGLRKRRLSRILPLQFESLRRLPHAALKNHVLNLSLSVPEWVLPILVTTLLSAATGGTFFIAWMIAGVALFVPAAIAQALYAVSSRAPETLAPSMRMTLRLSFVAGVVIWLVTLTLGPIALGLLGHRYFEAAPALIILTLGVFPVAIKAHYVTIGRFEGSMVATARLCALGAAFEIALAAAGALVAGITGVALGILLGLIIQAITMAPRIRRVLRGESSGGGLAIAISSESSLP